MKTYTQFRNDVLSGKTSCQQEVNVALNEINKNKDRNYFISVLDAETASVAAKESDTRFANGTPRKLEGMLVGVKDNISVLGMKTTCASKMLADYESIYDATCIERLKNAGAIIIGKTNMDEFAMGSSNETSNFGICKNPHNKEHVTGGSSGGSAAAVACGLCHSALGTDTGGSIRQPAAHCGSIGFKPTYGRVSRYGVFAFASSLDHPGTLTACIDDTALLLDAISGTDEKDATCKQIAPTDTYSSIDQPLPAKFKVGILPDRIINYCNADVQKIYSKYLETLRNLGAEFVTLNFDFIDVCVPTYIVLTTSEASSNFSRFDSIRYGYRAPSDTDYVRQSRGDAFGIEVKRRLLMGTYFLANESNSGMISKAKKIRSIFRKKVGEAFNDVDIIFTPSTGTSAFKSNERSGDPVEMYMSDFFTITADLAGNPAISFPAGKSDNGLPIGMQLQTGLWDEATLFRYAKVLFGASNIYH